MRPPMLAERYGFADALVLAVIAFWLIAAGMFLAFHEGKVVVLFAGASLGMLFALHGLHRIRHPDWRTEASWASRRWVAMFVAPSFFARAAGRIGRTAEITQGISSVVAGCIGGIGALAGAIWLLR